jgi:3beta-hydroxy-Delta5-steroid dehydrogenase / steroid Delta-isomerase
MPVAALPVRAAQATAGPLAVDRIYLDNNFSVGKAGRDLGYRPLFTTEQAMADCLPYYRDLYTEMKAAGQRAPAPA